MIGDPSPTIPNFFSYVLSDIVYGPWVINENVMTL